MTDLHAHTTDRFQDLTQYLDKIITLLGDHDMQVDFADGRYVANSPMAPRSFGPLARRWK